MIYLSNGSKLEFLISSGVFGFDGNGYWWQKVTAISGLLNHPILVPITKTLTLYPEKGNFCWWKPWQTIRPVKEGLVNAVGLTNPGVKWWLEKIYPSIESQGKKIILSIAIKNKSELQKILNCLPSTSSMIGIELNISCSNRFSYNHHDTEDILPLADLIMEKNWPLIIKIGTGQDYFKIARALDRNKLAAALSINGIPWSIWSGKTSPLIKYGGGIVTGKPAQSHNWKIIKELAQCVPTPIIGTGIWEYEDLLKLKELGTKAFGFGTICLLRPWKPLQFIKRWRKK